MNRVTVFVLSVAGLSVSAHAFEFRCRFVERVGNVDIPIQNGLYIYDNQSRNIRIQMGVFDDAAGAAPAGGLLGWNVGTLSVVAPHVNATFSRNPGRLAPFNFAQQPNANGNPPLPGGDPFRTLTEIDATLGTQSPVWVCDAAGNAPAQPAPVIRGVNTFVSVFALRIDPIQGPITPFILALSGNLLAGTSWQTIGTPVPPDCGDPANPSDDVAGSVTYVPSPLAPREFSWSLYGEVGIPPAPGTGMVLLIGGVFRARRVRR